MRDLRQLVIGVDELVPARDGSMVRYVNLDNAATAPVMGAAMSAVERLLPIYASVHRGSGHKSRLCTVAYEDARRIIGEFLGADPDRDTVVFTKNTTEAINKLARSIPIEDGDVVVTTVLEHHSNDLPWRARVRTVHVGACSDGSLDLDDLERCLAVHAGRVRLVVVSGASNVTGVVPPIHDIARRVHAAGGRIVVDAAQLAPHRRIDMGPMTIPSISTMSHCRRTSCTRRSAAAPLSATATALARLRIIAAAAPSTRSPSTTSRGVTFPTARRRGRQT